MSAMETEKDEKMKIFFIDVTSIFKIFMLLTI